MEVVEHSAIGMTIDADGPRDVLAARLNRQQTGGNLAARVRIGAASGITLGLGVSIGGIASPVIGWLADTTSRQVALAP